MRAILGNVVGAKRQIVCEDTIPKFSNLDVDVSNPAPTWCGCSAFSCADGAVQCWDGVVSCLETTRYP